MTNEGGYLRPAMREGVDFELVSPALWNALLRWHGTSANTLSLPRQVVRDAQGQRPTIELYPPTIIILRHQTGNSFPNSMSNLTSALFGRVYTIAYSIHIIIIDFFRLDQRERDGDTGDDPPNSLMYRDLVA